MLTTTEFRNKAYGKTIRPSFGNTVVPEVIGALGGGLKKSISDVMRILPKLEIVLQTLAEMQNGL